MQTDIADLRPTIVPKSDQLNAEQLLGGPMTVTVTDVRVGSSDEQPVIVHYQGDNGRPFKPCKTMRKVLIFGWGEDGRQWIGRSMTLYNDPDVKFGGMDVGGIRISHMTDIERDLKVSLTATKGKKALHTIRRMDAPQSSAAGAVRQIKASGTVETLKETFGAAYRATKDQAARAMLKTAYDSRLAELMDAMLPVKTLADYVAGIDGATSKETAALVLDEASAVLGADDQSKLVEAFTMAWGSN